MLLLFLPFESSKAEVDDDREGREGRLTAAVERVRREEVWSIGGVKLMSISEREEGSAGGKAWELSMAREEVEDGRFCGGGRTGGELKGEG